jgi:hypothetical protein
MNKFLSLAALAVVLVDSAFAQQATFQDSFLDRLVGRWVLRGEIAGKQTIHDVTSEWVLGHQYVRLHEVSREKNAAGQPAYEAMVFIGWDQSAREYACLWLDSTSTSGFSSEGAGHAKRAGDEIPFVFRDVNHQVSFRNTFSYDQKTDSWAWRMDNVQNGKDVPFGRVKLSKN